MFIYPFSANPSHRLFAVLASPASLGNAHLLSRLCLRWVFDFGDKGCLIRAGCLMRFLFAGRRFVCGFFEIPPRNGYPCCPADTLPSPVGKGLRRRERSRPKVIPFVGNGRDRSLQFMIFFIIERPLPGTRKWSPTGLSVGLHRINCFGIIK